MSAARQKANRSGFTLVELLVVITIIGIIAGLLTVGLYAAFGKSKDFILANEITQVSTALEAFKQKYGVYPPDMTDVCDLTINPGGNNSVTAANLGNFKFFSAFINKAYPRADRNAIVAFCNRVRFNSGKMDQAEALTFFLGGTSKDPRFPLGRLLDPTDPPESANYVAPQANELEIFFEFPAGSLVNADGDATFEFMQKTARGAPLVYFDARTYTSLPVATGAVQVGFSNTGYLNTSGIVTPYASSVTGTNYIFHNPKSFQLISAGQNGEFGVDVSAGIGYPIIPLKPVPSTYIPSSQRIIDSDGDNIANFTSGQTFDAYLVQ